MRKDLFEMFAKANDSKLNDNSDCHRCPFGEKFEYLEKLNYPQFYRNLPNFRDACLVQNGYKPKQNSPQCQGCFESWFEDRKDEGKICVKCGKWMVGGKGKAAMYIQIGDKKHPPVNYHSVCDNCLTGGRTIDEWARDILVKASTGKAR